MAAKYLFTEPFTVYDISLVGGEDDMVYLILIMLNYIIS
jgi:hypothetical protein